MLTAASRSAEPPREQMQRSEETPVTHTRVPLESSAAPLSKPVAAVD